MVDPGDNVNGNVSPKVAVTVSMVEAVDAGLEADVARLVPQLSSSAPPPTAAQLRRIIEDPATTLWTARVGSDQARIVGILTLVVFTLPTGVRAWVEDVVTDDAARGAGVASALINAAVAYAERSGARTIDLTSRPHREAANRLYQRLGFVQRETNVYRYTPGTGAGSTS